MTLDALKHRDITKIDRMFERLLAVMAIGAFVIGEHSQIQPGQKVLINGAAGGVGTFAVQIAASSART